MSTIYFNSLRGKKGQYGIKISGKAEDIIKEIQQHTNSKGFINLELKERREPDKYGQTHYLTVDTWEPQPRQEQPVMTPQQPIQNTNIEDAQLADDLPF